MKPLRLRANGDHAIRLGDVYFGSHVEPRRHDVVTRAGAPPQPSLLGSLCYAGRATMIGHPQAWWHDDG